jgi:hypothetical protein
MKYLFTALTFLQIFVLPLDAQSLSYPEKHELLESQLTKLSDIHNSIFNIRDELINGVLYYTRGNSIVHPYFNENSWKSGEILYSGHVFQVEMLKYDINSDYLIVLFQRGKNGFPVYLNKEVIKEFIITGHHFRYLSEFNAEDEDGPVPGYYEIIYNGKTRLYVRWTKSESLERHSLETDYIQNIECFLEKEGKYLRIKNQKSFINSLNEHEEEIRSYMRKNGMRFSPADYKSIIKVLELYDNL